MHRETGWWRSTPPTTLSFVPIVRDGKNAKLKTSFCAGSKGARTDTVATTIFGVALSGEDYARQFGLTYCVRSSRDIDWVYQHNIQFLEDYLCDDLATVSPVAKNRLVAHVVARPGISLQELLAAADGGATLDDAYLLIALGELYVDLYNSPLAQPATVPVFSNRQAAGSSELDAYVQVFE